MPVEVPTLSYGDLNLTAEGEWQSYFMFCLVHACLQLTGTAILSCDLHPGVEPAGLWTPLLKM